MASKIIVRHSSIVVEDYELGDCINLERMLSTWDNITYTATNYFNYNAETKQLRLPRGMDVNMLERMLKCRASLDVIYDPYDNVTFKLKVFPRNDIQKKAISFVIGEREFTYTKKVSQVSLNLNTGIGKTYCVIASMTSLGMKSMIITHINKIKYQWLESLQEFTTLSDKHIFDIDSSEKIDRLLSGKINTKYHKVYLVNHRSISSYAKKHGWDSIMRLFVKLGIGLKVYDEAHLEFSNICNLDQYTNTFKTIYLTANFEKTGDTYRVFKSGFGNIVKYGEEVNKELDRHITYMGYIFNTYPMDHEKLHIRGVKGFDRNRYSDYQKDVGKMVKVVDSIVDRYINNNPHKVLVLFSKIDMVELYTNRLQGMFPDKSIGSIHSKLSNEEKANISELDIICSTPKSAGTGVDIKDLGMVIMCEPYSSKITANQVAGRLRYLGEGKESFYIELVDEGFDKVYSMYRDRLKIFKRKCKRVLKVKV